MLRLIRRGANLCRAASSSSKSVPFYSRQSGRRSAPKAASQPLQPKPEGYFTQSVKPDDSDMRLDRWIRSKYPTIPQALLEKLLRQKQIMWSPNTNESLREEWQEVSAKHKVPAGSVLKLPLFFKSDVAPKRTFKELDPAEAREVQSWVLYKDKDIIVINKPSELAVQGGTGIRKSLADKLHGLMEEGDEYPPMLVHRLDQNASGILVLARTKTAARTLSDQWMNHEVRKLYWAVVLGKPRHKSELIKTKLTRITSPGSDGHKVEVIPLGEDSGRTFGESDSKVAVTQYDLIARSGDAIAFVALKPRTGRTHQLRVHCASVLGTPILGDDKYGGSFPQALDSLIPKSAGSMLHLHAREIAFKHPSTSQIMNIMAPPPRHMLTSLKAFAFDGNMNDETSKFTSTEIYSVVNGFMQDSAPTRTNGRPRRISSSHDKWAPARKALRDRGSPNNDRKPRRDSKSGSRERRPSGGFRRTSSSSRGPPSSRDRREYEHPIRSRDGRGGRTSDRRDGRSAGPSSGRDRSGTSENGDRYHSSRRGSYGGGRDSGRNMEQGDRGYSSRGGGRYRGRNIEQGDRGYSSRGGGRDRGNSSRGGGRDRGNSSRGGGRDRGHSSRGGSRGHSSRDGGRGSRQGFGGRNSRR